jgi:hypothetical protein
MRIFLDNTINIGGNMKKLILLLLVILSSLVINEKNFAQTTTIKMNEIYSNGKSTSEPALDWIELYNPTSAAISIAGYKIYDSGGQGGTKPKMTIPTGTTIAAKGFYVVTTDISTTTDPSGFGLSSGGEEVWLENASGTVIDDVIFPALTETQSYCRYPDGGATLKILTPFTKGVSNSVILMNEIYSNGKSTTHPELDWIELYNYSSAAVSIAGYKIYDSGGQGGTKPKMTIAAGITIPAKGYYVVTTDISTTTDPSGFGLSSGGEEVWLEDATGIIVDDVIFPALTETQSYSRVPDGTTWKVSSTVTGGTTNGTGTAVERTDAIPTGFSLDQNYPNPFNPSTMISYQLPVSGYTTLNVYDQLGKEITTLVNEFQSAGSYRVNFNAEVKSNNQNISSGVYFYKLTSSNFTVTKKMILMK